MGAFEQEFDQLEDDIVIIERKRLSLRARIVRKRSDDSIYVDIRLWEQSSDGRLWASKKGFTLSMAETLQLRAALVAMELEEWEDALHGKAVAT